MEEPSFSSPSHSKEINSSLDIGRVSSSNSILFIYLSQVGPTGFQHKESLSSVVMANELRADRSPSSSLEFSTNCLPPLDTFGDYICFPSTISEISRTAAQFSHLYVVEDEWSDMLAAEICLTGSEMPCTRGLLNGCPVAQTWQDYNHHDPTYLLDGQSPQYSTLTISTPSMLMDSSVLDWSPVCPSLRDPASSSVSDVQGLGIFAIPWTTGHKPSAIDPQILHTPQSGYVNTEPQAEFNKQGCSRPCLMRTFAGELPNASLRSEASILTTIDNGAHRLRDRQITDPQEGERGTAEKYSDALSTNTETSDLLRHTTYGISTHQETTTKGIKGSVQCHLCENVFDKPGHWKAHMFDHHEGQFKCPICAKTFPGLNYLGAHMKSHKGPFNCAKCRKVFQKHSNLSRHMRSHDPKRLMKKCPIGGCERKYARGSCLARHLKSVRLLYFLPLVPIRDIDIVEIANDCTAARETSLSLSILSETVQAVGPETSVSPTGVTSSPSRCVPYECPLSLA